MIILSQELSAISADLLSRSEPLSLDEMRDTATFLGALARLSASQDRELEVHRLREATQQGKLTISMLISQHSSELLSLHRSKLEGDTVIRPDFSKGGRS